VEEVKNGEAIFLSRKEYDASMNKFLKSLQMSIPRRGLSTQAPTDSISRYKVPVDNPALSTLPSHP
jgi:hypothetical protein